MELSVEYKRKITLEITVHSMGFYDKSYIDKLLCKVFYLGEKIDKTEMISYEISSFKTEDIEEKL